jgi:DNA repair photolyase
MFLGETETEFSNFIRKRYVLQWGSMSDPFCYFEKKQGISLQLLQFFRSIKYPITFSTKGVFYTEDERYREQIRNTPYWHWKISIITSSDVMASRLEKGCPSTTERFRAMSRLKSLGVGGVTMRLRPIVPGITTSQLPELVKRCADSGGDSISTEFFCLELRALGKSKGMFDRMSKLIGFDIVEYYRKHSKGGGYQRLNKNLKRRYFDELRTLCDKHKVKLYISDADFKEWSCNASCCGIPGDGRFNYFQGSFLYALIVARNRGVGSEVYWQDVAEKIGNVYDRSLIQSTSMNTGTNLKRAVLDGFNLRDFLHNLWNSPNSGNSPYKIFGGVLHPVRVDKNKNVVYEYRPHRGDEPKLKKVIKHDANKRGLSE